MDALSYVLDANRVTGMVAMQLRARGSWGLAGVGTGDAVFFVMAQGGCWVRVAGHPPVQLVRGDILLLPEGSAHAVTSSRNGRAQPAREVLAEHPPGENRVVDLGGSGPAVHVIGGEFIFEHDRPHPVLSLLPPLMHIPGAPTTGGGELSAVVHMLANELVQPRPGSDTVIAHLADVMFVHILRAWLAVNDSPGPSWLAALRDGQIGTALARLHAHPDRSWTIESLAAEVSMSRAAFARRFTRLVGEAPLTYLARWRLNLAARRLRDTDESVAAVAGHVGYGSEYSFSRAFTRFHGQPPARYRRESRAAYPGGSAPRTPRMRQFSPLRIHPAGRAFQALHSREPRSSLALAAGAGPGLADRAPRSSLALAAGAGWD